MEHRGGLNVAMDYGLDLFILLSYAVFLRHQHRRCGSAADWEVMVVSWRLTTGYCLVAARRRARTLCCSVSGLNALYEAGLAFSLSATIAPLRDTAGHQREGRASVADAAPHGRRLATTGDATSMTHNFQTASTSSGTSCMIPLRTLKKQSAGFIINNSCVFGVEFIKIVTSKANDMSETLFVQKMNNTFNDPEVYIWDIEDFFALKSLDKSPEFEICGQKWSITIYPSGSGNNGNYLSLYLKMKMPHALHQESAILVELSMCIKDQETGKHRKITGRCQFSRNSTTWGWDKFISMEDFKNSSNGYLVKTKCCIEVEVAIIGSSKME